MDKAGALLGCAWLLALCAGCTSAPRPLHLRTDARSALEAQRGERDAVVSIRAEARVDQRGERGRIRGTVLMFVQRPARVRLDAMTQFGPAAVLTSDGARFAYADLREGRYLSGPTCPANVARLLGVPLSIEETAQFLLGGTPLIEPEEREIAWHGDGFYRVSLRRSDGVRQEVDLAVEPDDLASAAEAQGLRLLRSELYRPDGQSVWRVRYGDFRPLQVNGRVVMMPFRVHVEQPGQGRDTLVRFKEVVFDTDVPDEAFTQRPRAGMKQEEAPCD